MNRFRSRSLLCLLSVPLLAITGCGEDSVGASGGDTESGGIDSLSGSGTEGTSTGEMPDPDSSSGGPLLPCENGERDGDETDVDCGGATCGPCGPGGQCDSNDDCDTMICGGGFCQTPTCYDGFQNGSESGVDCGGSCPNSCAATGCQNNNQCDTGEFCLDGACMPSSCENGIQDTMESSVDCGGDVCPVCLEGDSCNVDTDCEHGVCGDDGFCSAPACDDGVENGDETDIDCGGMTCGACPNGSDCLFGTDCDNGVCDNGLCVNDTCIDMVQNGSETDEDCGGPECPACADTLMCIDPSDCVSGNCDMGLCVGAACMDGVENGDETDLDCGGSCGATCDTGEQCNAGGDCVSAVCEFGVCSAPDCSDSVQNGDETDVDCGGSCGANCGPADMCIDAGDCVEGVCVGNLCAAPTCVDNVENGDETDLDCGGTCGATCIPGEDCSNGGDCTEGVCVLGVCQAPSCTDGVQNGTEVGIDCAGNCDQPCPVGPEVVVNTTLPDFQTQPAVAAPPGGAYYVVVWASFPVASPPQDGNGSGIFMRVYDAGGAALTGEVQVNTTTMGNQQFPAVDARDAGFVVTWQGPDADGNGIFARRFDSAGAPVGGEIVVPPSATNNQRRPDVAVQSNGDFVVCWDEQVQTFEIRCQRFLNAGTSNGPLVSANLTTANNQNLPVVEVNDLGNYTVAWQSAGGQDGSSVGVYARRFSSAGAPLTPSDQLVNQTTAGDQQGPAIGMNSAGQTVIAWSADEGVGVSTDVFARRYDANLAPQGGEFQVNATTSGAQNNPAVALNGAGAFVVVWQTEDDGVLTGVFAQRYGANGVASGSEFTVNPTVLGLQEEPDVAVRGPDEIVGVWSSDPAATFVNRDVVLQRYDAEFP
jgi:hypothetical protein